MDAELSSQLEQLTREIAELRRRIARLETSAQLEPITPAPIAYARSTAMVSRQLAFVGRTLIVLGGAYLIRAFTDGEFFSPALGASIGLLYAAVMLVIAHRSAPRDRASASHHGFAAALIAFPLIFETTTRLAILSPASGSAALAIFLALGLLIAWQRELPFVAWTSLGFALVTALALLVTTGHVVPFAIALFVAAALCEALAFDARWRPLRWPPALALDLVILQLGVILLRSDGLPDSYAPISLAAAVTLLLALPVLYLGSIAARTIALGRIITNFGIFQCSVALLLGIGGGARLLLVHGASLRGVGAVAFALGAASYAVAYAHAARRTGRERNFSFYVTLGGLLTLVGSALALDGIARPIAWSLFALFAAWMGARHHRRMLRWHTAAYLLATVVTGSWIAAIALLACYLVGMRESDRIPDAVVAALFLFTLFGLLSRGLALAIPDAGFVAAARSGAITVAAVTMAWLATRRSLRELGWLVHPVIVIGGLKLLVEDFRVGRPASLVLSLALFGAALIVVPRLLRK